MPDRPLKELKGICDKVRVKFDAKDVARERGLTLAREVIRNSANAIRSIHRAEYEEAQVLMEASAGLLRDAAEALTDHPDVRFAGFLQDAQKEHSEARQTYALIRGERLPDPDELGVEYAPYLNALGEAIGELRRHALDRIRHNEIGWGDTLLALMDEIYYAMVSFDYPPAICGQLKRTADITRSLIERTRGDLTNAMRQQRLEAALTEIETRLNSHPTEQQELPVMSKRKIIFSAMQITGRLHLGNLEGALANWVRLQDEYELYAGIVDLHSLTTAYEDTSQIKELMREAAIDYLAAGLDPEKMTLVLQSRVPAHCELHVLLSMLTPLGWLERVPTFKEKKEQLHIAMPSYGLLGYPVLMAADILVYRADTVPVGRDQVPHLELTREIARRFNYYYGEVFPEPQALLTEFAVLPGLDGRKMSKSYGNCIYLSDSEQEVRDKVKTMFTDPMKLRKNDPGHPDECPVQAYHAAYSPGDAPQFAEDCKSGALGCVAHKKAVAEMMVSRLTPHWERRAALSAHPERLDEILDEGARKANAKTRETMELVWSAMKLR